MSKDSLHRSPHKPEDEGEWKVEASSVFTNMGDGVRESFSKIHDIHRYFQEKRKKKKLDKKSSASKKDSARANDNADEVEEEEVEKKSAFYHVFKAILAIPMAIVYLLVVIYEVSMVTLGAAFSIFSMVFTYTMAYLPLLIIFGVVAVPTYYFTSLGNNDIRYVLRDMYNDITGSASDYIDKMANFGMSAQDLPEELTPLFYINMEKKYIEKVKRLMLENELGEKGEGAIKTLSKMLVSEKDEEAGAAYHALSLINTPEAQSAIKKALAEGKFDTASYNRYLEILQAQGVNFQGAYTQNK